MPTNARLSCKCSPVLVVDDNEFNIYILQEMLKVHFNLTPDEAVHGQQAVEKFR